MFQTVQNCSLFFIWMHMYTLKFRRIYYERCLYDKEISGKTYRREIKKDILKVTNGSQHVFYLKFVGSKKELSVTQMIFFLWLVGKGKSFQLFMKQCVPVCVCVCVHVCVCLCVCAWVCVCRWNAYRRVLLFGLMWRWMFHKATIFCSIHCLYISLIWAGRPGGIWKCFQLATCKIFYSNKALQPEYGTGRGRLNK